MEGLVAQNSQLVKCKEGLHGPYGETGPVGLEFAIVLIRLPFNLLK